jgi:hypothetical protein
MRFGHLVARQPEAPAEETATPESDGSSGASGSVPSSAEGSTGQPNATASPTPEQTVAAEAARDTLVLTPEEFNRRVQAETDRRLDKFQREEAERRKREEKRRLRDTDPYAYAQMEKEDEEKTAALQSQLAEVHKLASSTVDTYDKTVLDPLMRAVPEAQRRAILSSIEPGLPGRGQAAVQALKALESHYTQVGIQKARETLMKDQSFIKEVLAKYGGMRQEPEHIPANGSAAPVGLNPNDSLRMARDRLRRG